MPRKAVLTTLAIASCSLAATAMADVHLVRRGGSVLIFNDPGSGWTSGGRGHSDAYLVARRARPSPFDETIHREARNRGVDPSLVKSIMLIESNFNPRAMSPKGARGLMQLMPATARQYGVTLAKIFEPLENIRGGIGYLADLLQLYGGNVPLALAAYNAGSGAVARYGGVPPYSETKEYVRRGLVAYTGDGAVPPDAVAPVIGGAFRGQLAAKATPVLMDRTSRLLSNTTLAERTAPILGRVTNP